MNKEQDVQKHTRQYSVYRKGSQTLHGRGTFNNEELLRQDYPADAYTLVLDEYHSPAQRTYTYAEMRRMEYPTAAELGDALYWQAKGDNSKMEAYLAACEAVKLKYPKS